MVNDELIIICIQEKSRMIHKNSESHHLTIAPLRKKGNNKHKNQASQEKQSDNTHNPSNS